MHEMSLINNLLEKINDIAAKENAKKVKSVTVWLGALSHISAGHFREHFVEGVAGTPLEGSELQVETSDDTDDPNAQSILLKSVDVED